MCCDSNDKYCSRFDLKYHLIFVKDGEKTKAQVLTATSYGMIIFFRRRI